MSVEHGASSRERAPERWWKLTLLWKLHDVQLEYLELLPFRVDRVTMFQLEAQKMKMEVVYSRQNNNTKWAKGFEEKLMENEQV